MINVSVNSLNFIIYNLLCVVKRVINQMKSKLREKKTYKIIVLCIYSFTDFGFE